MLFAAHFYGPTPLRLRASDFLTKLVSTTIEHSTKISSPSFVQPVQKGYKKYQKLKPLPLLGKMPEIFSVLPHSNAAIQDMSCFSEAEKKRYMPPPLGPTLRLLRNPATSNKSRTK